MLLSECKKGDVVEIQDVGDKWVRERVIPFGITKGMIVSCESLRKRGPIVVKKNNQRIAVGFSLAKKIRVSKVVKPCLKR